MFFKLRYGTFVIGFLVISSLWMAVTFLPVLYSIAFPPRDLRQIMLALESGGDSPSVASPAVAEVVASAGFARRAIPVGYYSGVSATLKHNDSHTDRTIQVSYVAWFQKMPHPILLLITRSETDGVLEEYRIDEGAPMSLVRAYALPMDMFVFSLFLYRRRRLRTVSAA